MTEVIETELAEEIAPKVGMTDYASRAFPVELYPGVGRTVDLRIVPYGERIRVNDGLGGVPRGVEYEEEFVPGVFDGQINAANRVYLDHEHEPGLRGVVGHGVELASRSDGFYGSFRLLDGADGDKALALIREGVLGGASVQCHFKRSIRTMGGVIQRVRAHLDRVALCRTPAYPGAVVLGVRNAPPEFDKDLLPHPFDPELAARVAALGIELPQRLTAHPATGTPDDSGTPDDDTRPRRDDSHDYTEVTPNGGNGSRGETRSSR